MNGLDLGENYEEKNRIKIKFYLYHWTNKHLIW
jgi:hypothetical protein